MGVIDLIGVGCEIGLRINTPPPNTPHVSISIYCSKEGAHKGRSFGFGYGTGKERKGKQDLLAYRMCLASIEEDVYTTSSELTYILP